MTSILSLTNPFENSVLNYNETQLEKERQILQYFEAVNLGYVPPPEIVAELAAILALEELSSEALARLQTLLDLINGPGTGTPPEIDGGDFAQVTMDENTTFVTTVTAVDQFPDNDGTETLTYSIAGGADAALFEIDQITGELSFIAAPDFEAPVGGDNTYEVVIQVNDGVDLMDTQTIQVTVNDVDEAVPPSNFGALLNGIDAADTSGYSVASAGDVNGDGYDDILIGANFADPGVAEAGETYLVYGSASGLPPTVDLASLDGSNGFVMNGIAMSDTSGVSVSSAGDINNDGFDDMLIAAPSADPDGRLNAGQTYVVFGSATGVDVNGSFDLSSLNGTNGFVIDGVAAADRLGFSVASAGDVNGDGIDDIIIAAPTASPNGTFSGATYVVYGSATGFAANFDLSTLDGTNGFVMNGLTADDRSGYSVSSAGDVNGDGLDDMLIGAFQADEIDGTTSGVTNVGETYVVFGSTTSAAELDLSALDGTNGFVVNGIDAFDYSGESVSSAGDVNGDGFADILIGASDADASVNGPFDTGETYVVYGTDTGFSAELDLADLDGTNGFIMKGVDGFDYSGLSVSSAGDVNGDGFDDILIGASSADPNGFSSGESYLVFGAASGIPANVNLSELDGTNGFVFNGIDAFDFSGHSVSSAGDVNGDGFDDLLISAFRADPLSPGDAVLVDAGETYLVYGGDTILDAFDLEDTVQDGSIDLSLLTNATDAFVF